MPAEQVTPAGGSGAPDGAGSPPRLAAELLARRLPEEVADAVAGDLEEDYRLRLLPRHGRVLADLWYWGQALTVRAGALRRAADRLRAMRPTWERNRPHRAASHHDPDPWSRLPMQPQDLKYAVRRLIRSPGFTLVAVLSLALGIGANTAMFSVVNAFLIRSLPVERPDEVVEIYTSDSGGYAYATSSYPDFQDIRNRTDVFSGVVGTRTFIARLDRDGTPDVVFGELVSWDYFDVLGVKPALGRFFLEEEDRTPGTHPVVVLGYQQWVTSFGRNRDVLGSTVHLNGRPFTVVGVAPEAFSGTMPVLVSAFYSPLMMTDVLMGGRFATAGSQLDRRGSRSMFLKARLKPGVTVEQADAALGALAGSLAERYPDSNESRIMSVLPTGDVALHPLVDRVLVPVAGLLLVVVGLVLLIACANLASFLLARAEERRKEIAVRLALGAGRAALVRQLLLETTVLALLGGAGGLLLARWTLDLVMKFRPPLPVPVNIDVSLDRTVLAFTLGVSVLAGLLFGLVPAIQSTSPDVAPTLKDESAGAPRPGRFNVRGALVVTQVAFSFLLLIGAGLFVRSLQKAQLIDPGFDAGPGAVLWADLPLSGFDTPEEGEVVLRTLEEQLLADPAITAVGTADRLPLGAGVQAAGFLIPGAPSERPDGVWDVDNTHVTPGYFTAMDVDVLQGPGFEGVDPEGERVVVVSEAFVSRFFPGEDAVGRIFQTGGGVPLRIVGVARDTKVRTLGEAPRPYVYQLQGQPFVESTSFIVRGPGTGPELLAAARRVIQDVAPNLVLLEAKTMEEHLALLLFAPRMAALLLSVFGGLALLLAAIGVYGVVSYAVARRTREMGIRISLGASTLDVIRMAVGAGMKLVVAGGIAGVVLAGAVTWSISGYLYGIESTDVVTFVSIPAILTAVALVAAFVPARRAATVDPVLALRSE